MKSIFVFLLILSSAIAEDKFLSNTLGSHMVLPRAPNKASLWGWTATQGVTVTAVLNGNHTFTTQSQAEGYWKIDLDAQQAGGPHTITLTNTENANKVELEDILFGDVFFCSGQSNMQMTVSAAFNATEEIAHAGDYPNIRVFTAAMHISDHPIDQLIGVSEVWSRASNDSIGVQDIWKWFSATCWYFGKNIHTSTNVPIGLVTSSWGGTIVQAWSSPNAMSQCNATAFGDKLFAENSMKSHNEMFMFYDDPNKPNLLWNAMVVPFLNWKFTGVAWYQGESNQDQPAYYSCAFPAMIRDWAERFQNPNLPFYFVQVATWRGDLNKIPALRIAQTSALKLKNVAMATAFDLNDAASPAGDIHPRSKPEVGRRLSLPALAQIYNQKVRLGPVLDKVIKVNTNTVAISFQAGSGVISLKNPVCTVEPQYCGQVAELQTADDVWHAATYKLVGQKFVMTLDGAADVKAARYAFADYPLAVIYNDVDLPLPPFVVSL